MGINAVIIEYYFVRKLNDGLRDNSFRTTTLTTIG